MVCRGAGRQNGIEVLARNAYALASVKQATTGLKAQLQQKLAKTSEDNTPKHPQTSEINSSVEGVNERLYRVEVPVCLCCNVWPLNNTTIPAAAAAAAAET
jgi:hypothetical protein